MPSQAASSFATTVGQNVKLARDLRGLTQRQLANAIDADANLVSKWERSWHRPSEENLVALAEALGQPIAWFYTDHSSEKAAA
jgi:transcriptional regulator with XRE-family HTH domain